MAIPTFVNAGASASNLAAITPGMPASVLTGDILICAVETDFEVTNTTLSGGTETWTEVTGSPVTTGASTRLAVFWARASQNFPTSPTTNDTGNHQNGQILAYRGGKTSGNPWNTTPTTKTQAAGTTAISITGLTTTTNDSLILYIVSGDLPDAISTTEHSAWADASLSGVTERIDFANTAGNGGSLGAAEGGLATAGASGTMTATKVTASTLAEMCLEIASPGALSPPPRRRDRSVLVRR